MDASSSSSTPCSSSMTVPSGSRGAVIEGAFATVLISPSAIVFFLAPRCPHGDIGRFCFSSPELIGLDLVAAVVMFVSCPMEESSSSRAMEVPESPSSPSKRLSLEDLLDIARNSASKSASSAAPPRSPTKVFGRFDRIARSTPDVLGLS